MLIVQCVKHSEVRYQGEGEGGRGREVIQGNGQGYENTQRKEKKRNQCNVSQSARHIARHTGQLGYVIKFIWVSRNRKM